MKSVVVFLFVVAFAFAAEYYTDKYDNIDIDAILKNGRLFGNYVNCLLDMGRCTEEGRVLKQVVPDALITNCQKCSPRQRASVEKVVRFLVKERRRDFDLLAAKYDPQGIYRRNYAHLLENL